MKKILLVEDDKETRDGVYEFLKERRYHVVCAIDGEEALNLFENDRFDIVLLDIMLPKANGFVVLNHIRKKSNVPVLMLTAMNDEYTQIMSFDEQADDYITKPFSLLLLEKRIEALLRRSAVSPTPTLWKYKQSEVDFQGYSATHKNEKVDLKPKEILLLKLLLEHSGQMLTRNQILDHLWSDDAPMDRVIDVYIKNLRKKLQLDCIITVKGIGYKFEVTK
ncbi:MAG: response regulator transcription factor [Beduini sp.]|uniref:response regulator transcription factor n=3 Tax=Beduini sp. TaxID=1922300 RepID=UPI0011C8D74A